MLKVLDFWPFASGLSMRYWVEKEIVPHQLIESRAGGIGPLLDSIERHDPDVLLGDFGVPSSSELFMSEDEKYFRELRARHLDLAIVATGITAYSLRWKELATELRFVFFEARSPGKPIDFTGLSDSLEKAVRLTK